MPIVRRSASDARQSARIDWDKVRATTDADIDRQIGTDPDMAPAMTEAQIAADLDAGKAKRVPGRPRKEAPKVQTTLRLDAEVLAHFRATGPGWQSRINDALRELIGL